MTILYRNTPHESSGLNPNLLMLGWDINLPVDIMMDQLAPEEKVDEHEYAELQGLLEDLSQPGPGC